MRTLLILIALCTSAYAQAPGETRPMEPRVLQHRPRKSLAEAYLVTVASVSVPMVLAGIGSDMTGPAWQRDALGMLGVAGAVLGPSGGHWYVGHYWTTGLQLRLGAAAGVATLVIADPHAQNVGLLITGGLAAVGLWEAGVIVDLATLPRAVRRYNRVNMQVVPLLTHETQGLALAGSF